MKSLWVCFFAFGLSVVLMGCDSTDDEGIDRSDLPVGEWAWVPIDGAQCRDGSPTGLGIRVQEGATRLAIYLEGGGACFNTITCTQNLGFFGETEFNTFRTSRGDVGLFNTANADNPVGGWNMVYVPYCTGDVHMGDAPGTEIPFFGPQQFVGHRNMERYMETLASLFDDQENVLLTGSSAGGFGALFNFDLVAETFGPIVGTENLVLLNDSGPIFADDDALAPSLQQDIRDLWNLEDTLPADLPRRVSEDGDGLEDIYAYLSEQYPEARYGLFSYRHDEVIRFFFSFVDYDGNNLPPPIDAAIFEGALFDLRTVLPEDWRTYYAPGDDHGVLFRDDRFFSQTIDGQSVSMWLSGLLGGTATDVGTLEPAVATH